MQLPYYLPWLGCMKSKADQSQSSKLFIQIKHLAGRLRHNDFLLSTAILFSGRTMAQAVTLITAPILSRLYTPAQFGVSDAFFGVVTALAVVSTLRYEYAILLPEGDNDAANILALSALLPIGFAAFSLALILAGAHWIAMLLQAPALEIWLPLASPVALLIAFFQVLNFWSIRRKAFKLQSLASLFRSIVANSFQFLAGIVHLGTGGLIAGLIAGQAAALLTLGIKTWHQDKHLVFASFDLGQIMTLARRYSRFPRFSAAQGLVSALSDNMPIFLLTYHFNSEVVGWYGLAFRLLLLPIRLISESLGIVFLHKASEVHHAHGDMRALLLRATLGLAAVGIIPTLMIMLFGPQFLSFALGSNWYMSGIYSQWLAPWLFTIFLNPPSNSLTTVLQKQKLLFTWEIVTLIMKTAVLTMGGILHNPTVAIALLSIVGVASNTILMVAVWAASGKAPVRPGDSLDNNGSVE